MITYEIKKVDTHGKQLLVKFINSDTTLPEYYSRAALPEEFTESVVHQMCEEMCEEAAYFWQGWSDTASFTLTVAEGSVKDIQIEDAPDYNNLYERLAPVWTEDAATKFKSWERVAYTDSEKARNIRDRRDRLLYITDTETVSDRTPSAEMLAYRQSLRGVTDQSTFPTSIVWPIKPIG